MSKLPKFKIVIKQVHSDESETKVRILLNSLFAEAYKNLIKNRQEMTSVDSKCQKQI